MGATWGWLYAVLLEQVPCKTKEATSHSCTNGDRHTVAALLFEHVSMCKQCFEIAQLVKTCMKTYKNKATTF